MNEIAVLPAFKAALGFWRRGVGAAPGPLALAVAASVLEAAGAWLAVPNLRGVAVLIQVVGWVIASGAMTRQALAEDHAGEPAFRIGPFGFQVTAQDRRAAVALLLVLCVCTLAFAASVALAVLFNAVLHAFGLPDERSIYTSAVVAGALMIGGVCLLGVRASLTLPASLDHQRVTIPWHMTKGRFWPVLGAWVLVWAVAVVACAVLYAGVAPLLAVQTADAARLQAGPALIRGLVVSLALLPLSVGLSAHLYRLLR